MRTKGNYAAFYGLIYDAIGPFTPLTYDCGALCGGACCEGGEDMGMYLFPHEEEALDLSAYRVVDTENGKMVICDGQCDRENRPLSCRIFPFFPVLRADGRIEVLPDAGAHRLCPMLQNIDVIRFDKAFLRGVRRAGRLLTVDDDCREYLESRSSEMAKLLPMIYEVKPKSLIRK